MKIHALLDEGRLDVSTSFFKNYYTKQPCYIALEPLLPCKPIIGLWFRIAFSSLLHHQLSKYFALVEVAVVMVLKNMEDKCYFPTLSFMKSKLWNQLTTHLDLVVKIFVYDHYILDAFPFEDAIKDLENNKIRYSIDY